MKRILFFFLFFFTCICFTGCDSAPTYSVKANPLVRYFARPGSFYSYRYMRLLYQDEFHTLDQATQQGLMHGIMKLAVKEASVPASSSSVKTKRLIDYPTFMDDTGFMTTFKSIPRNVAVLDSSYAEIWELAGGSIQITVQETVTRGLVTKSSVTVIDQKLHDLIDYELLLSENPDLVIVNAQNSQHRTLATLLRVYDIPVLALNVNSFLDYLSTLRIFTEILNTPNHYKEYGSKLLDQVETIIGDATSSSQNHQVQVYIKQDAPPFVFHMLEDLGAIIITSSNIDASHTVVDNDSSENSTINENENTTDTGSDNTLDNDNGNTLDHVTENTTDTTIENDSNTDKETNIATINPLDNNTNKEQVQDIILDLTTKENSEMLSYLPTKRWPQVYEYLTQLLFGSTKE